MKTMTKKNIFVSFFVIKYFRFYFIFSIKTAFSPIPHPGKVHPPLSQLSQQPPLKIEILFKLCPYSLNLVGEERLNSQPPPPQRKAHYVASVKLQLRNNIQNKSPWNFNFNLHHMTGI